MNNSPVESTNIAVSVQEAARLLGVSRTSIYGLLRDSQLKSMKVGSRRLISRRSVLEFIEIGTGHIEVDR